MKKIFSIIICLIISTMMISQTKIEKSVVSSGATSANNSSIQLRGSLGQSSIGFSSSSQLKGNIGFWASYIAGLSTSIIEADPSAFFADFHLGQNYPNPAYSQTWVEIGLPQASQIEIHLYSIKGEALGILLNEKLGAGKHVLQLDVSNFPGGIYLYVLRKDKLSVASKKIQISGL
jgi:hypothetical protein